MSDAPPYARRFYKQAAVDEAGFGVRLDARALKTPRGGAFAAPTRALAEAVAAEWDAQGQHILPASMPLTQLAFAALDGGDAARVERIAYVLKYAETDLCCHRADAPAELVARQAEAWDPLVQWGREQGLALPVVTGVLAAEVPGESLAALGARTDALDDFRLTALAQAVGVSGSALIALALLEGRVDSDTAFIAAALDDLWSQERWGADGEAQARLARLKRDLSAVERFVRACST